jgi:membrane protease YdiL (CAAX protease family)
MDKDTKETQYSLARILAIWALAALPGGILFWAGLPILEKYTAVYVGYLVLIVLVIPYIWQIILALLVIKNDEGNLHWNTIKNRLWLKTTTDPRTGKENNVLWFWLIPFITLYALTQVLPMFQSINNWWTEILPIKEPVKYSFEILFENPDTLVGNWGFALVVLLVSILTMSEEIVFRGILLPKMKGVFGRADWIANGVLFALYHLDRPWAWPSFIIYSTVTIALPARLFKSTWFSIAVHFSQAFYFMFLILGLVLGLAK